MDEIKRKLRKLKKLEIKIRFGDMGDTGNQYIHTGKKALVWDEFFDLNEACSKKARYPAGILASMDKDNFRDMVDEFFFNVYYRYYKENGFINIPLYDPGILSWMGLSPDAGNEDIKKRFRELAKKHHPDTGGDSARFIELMENYKKLVE